MMSKCQLKIYLIFSIAMSKELVATQDKCIKNFCRTLQGIVKSMHNKNKQDMDLAEMREHLSIGVKDAPLEIFKKAGSHIWKYREDIYNSNVDEFLKKDYSEEIAEEVSDEKEVKKAHDLIAKIKRTWRFFNNGEKEDMIERCQNLVRQYAIYEDAARKIEAL
jgi:hypothetical protein